jgi:hypothetical protein
LTSDRKEQQPPRGANILGLLTLSLSPSSLLTHSRLFFRQNTALKGKMDGGEQKSPQEEPKILGLTLSQIQYRFRVFMGY